MRYKDRKKERKNDYLNTRSETDSEEILVMLISLIFTSVHCKKQILIFPPWLSQIENAKHLGDKMVWCQFDWSKAFTALDRGLVAHVARLIIIPMNLVDNLLTIQNGVTAMLSIHKEAQAKVID